MRPDCSAPPKSSWHDLLKEHKGGIGSIIMFLRGGNQELSCQLLASGMSRRTHDHFCIVVAIQSSRDHKS